MIRRSGRLINTMALATALLLPAQVAAQTCNSIGSAAEHVISMTMVEVSRWATCLAFAWETSGGSFAVCGAADAAQFAAHVYNNFVGNSWAEVGPRELGFNKESGTVVGMTGRVFLTRQMMPAGTKITLTKTGNRGRASVAVCLVDSNGDTWRALEQDFAHDEQVGSKLEWTYQGQRGDNVFLGIHIVGHQPFRSFKYDVQLSLGTGN